MNLQPNMATTLKEKLKTIEDAINYEIDQHYINARGKKTTFSNFIIQNTRLLTKELNSANELKQLMNLFYSYPTQDLNSRIQTIHKAQDILREIYKNNKEIFNKLCNTNALQKNKFFEKDLRKIDVKYVKGVGPKIAMLLNRLGIYVVNDLFYYFPRGYINYQKQKSIRELKLDEDVTIVGKIKNVNCFDPPRKNNLSIITFNITDGTGKITITKFFSRKYSKVVLSQYKKQFPEGTKVVCAGNVTFDKYTRSFSLSSATIEKIEEGNTASNFESLNTARIVPIYPLTEGLTIELTRKIVSNAFNVYGNLIQETLPKTIRDNENLLDLKTSLSNIHFPKSQELCNISRTRIVFDEFFFMQLELAYRRHLVEKNKSGLQLVEKEDSLTKKLIGLLPFELTNAQKRTLDEIKRDLMSDKPMHRLLQGDVGCGKTIVALLTLLFAIENGYQTALMAPTEILVNQHTKKFRDYLNPLGISVCELTGSTPQKQKKEILQNLANGELKIVVGTHALLQEDVKFKNLGLVIIDEQHRFGVKQRDDLLKKGRNVARLFMTATPIPRTLALALHGDLEMSEIDELPKGRIPIKTIVVQEWQRPKAFDLIKGEVAKGRQAYIVFPLIEESEALSAKAAEAEYKELSNNIFKDLKVGLMHGELPSREKEIIMEKFADGKIDVLVTTTVIEVGMDVSNATVMMIENAERFGLAQLHQLRGRIGRGGEQAYCLLVPHHYSEESIKRLEIMTKTTNGFIISQEDLKIRGPGEFLGTKQSGLPDLKLADLIQDTWILERARKKASEIISKDPALKSYPELREFLSKKQTYISAG